MPDPTYQTFPYIFASKGLAARFAIDRMPAQTYFNLDNLEVRQENSISTRFGRELITKQLKVGLTPLANTNIHTLGRLKSLTETYRYAGAGSSIFRRHGDTAGPYAEIGLPASSVPQPLGPQSGSQAINDGTVGTYDWSSPLNVFVSDDARAGAISSPATAQSHYLKVTGFDFSAIPDTATIIGVLVEIEGNTAGSTGGGFLDVLLVTNGNVQTVSTKTVDAIGTFPSSDTYVSFGSSSDKWGLPLTTAEVKDSSNFGVAVTFRGTGIGGDTPRFNIDHIRVTVYWSALSGKRFSMVVYRPDLSSLPYAFLADRGAMLKDDGTFDPLQRWGIFPPTVPALVEVQDPTRIDIELFEVDSGFTYTNFTGPTVITHVNTTITTAVTGAPTIVEVTPASMADIFAGEILTINTGGGTEEKVLVLEITATTFKAKFLNNHSIGETVQNKAIQGNVAANTEGTVKKSGAFNLDLGENDDDDEINVFLKVSNPVALVEIRLMFDVGDGSFTESYYLKAITPSDLQEVVDGLQTAFNASVDRVFDRAVGVIRPLEVQEPILPEEPEDPTVPFPLNPGLNQWTRVTVKRKDFVKVGRAGEPGHDWTNVNAWQVAIKTKESSSVTVALEDLYLFGGSGPDVFAGSSYDYRYTYYNSATGAESLGSQTMVEENFVDPRRQPVKITVQPSPDVQVTHARIYRRGGTLPTGWRKITDLVLPGGGVTPGTYIDRFSDTDISGNRQLEIDNDPPVNSTLSKQVDTTLGSVVSAGASQSATAADMTNIFPNQYVTVDGEDPDRIETVIVISITGTTFTAYFQRAHGPTARVQAQTRSGKPLFLAAIAFERAWVAGDSENPHILYYSKRFRPESFPPQNQLEIGKPDDPIMGIVEFRGQLIVFTLNTVYSVNVSAGVPIAFPTASRHGLRANFGWTEAEGEIWYISEDGLYSFRGGVSTYRTPIVEWLFTKQQTGPVPPMDLEQVSESLLAYDQNEVFLSYIDMVGVRRRLMYHTTYDRYRNDSIPATAMLFEPDTFKLIIGTNEGLIYIDRVGNADEIAPTGTQQNFEPIDFVLQTAAMDQGAPKNEKVYNELTIDADTDGQDIDVILVFDFGQTMVTIGTLNTVSREQVQFNINAGKGQISRNVSLKLVGSALSEVVFYEAHIRASIEAEQRKSFDSYWSKYGSDEFKFCKQGWFEYTSPGGPVTFSVYTEGSNTPEFTFTLPTSAVRRSMRVRFPAVKAKVWRWVAVGAEDFQLYNESFIELKLITSSKGYLRSRLAA